MSFDALNPAYASVQSDAFTVTSNTGDAAAIEASLAPAVEEAPAEVADADPKPPEATDDPAAGKPKGKPRNDPQARIDQAIAKQRDAERKAADLEARLAALERGKPEPVAAPAPVSTAADPEPDPADLTKYPDGQFDRKFLKDQARWEARQEVQAADQQRRAAESTSKRQADHERAMVAFNGRMAPVLEQQPEFFRDIDADVSGAWPLSALTDAQLATLKQALAANAPGAREAAAKHSLAEHVIRAERPDLWLRHFTAHKDDYQRLLTLPPEAFYRELGKLEARLDAAPHSASAPAPPPSHAKPPIKPVGSSPALAEDEPSEDESFERHFARENARDRKRALGR